MISDNYIQKQLLEWHKSGISTEEVAQRLQSMIEKPTDLDSYLNKYKNLKNNNRETIGFILMGVGGFLGFISCVFSIVIEEPFWNAFFLYGGTSLAVLIVMIGLYFLFE